MATAAVTVGVVSAIKAIRRWQRAEPPRPVPGDPAAPTIDLREDDRTGVWRDRELGPQSN